MISSLPFVMEPETTGQPIPTADKLELASARQTVANSANFGALMERRHFTKCCARTSTSFCLVLTQMSEARSDPLVSVVIAAYNSSARLRCAVESIMIQDFQDFEVVVVGDACSDNSEQVLQEFGSARIRWENLEQNWGEQSVPSNRGIELSNGEFIFFLNQDDIWLRNHVTSCLDTMKESSAELVWSPFLNIPPGSRPGDPRGSGVVLSGVTEGFPNFHPRTFIPASCTAWRASALNSIGGWRSAARLAVSPSQDLLWRAYRSGIRMSGNPFPTVLVLGSGSRPGSFSPEYHDGENGEWLRAVKADDGTIERELVRGSLTKVVVEQRKRTLKQVLRWRVVEISGSVAKIFGRHPHSLIYSVWYRRSGGYINTVRSKANLEKVNFRKRGKVISGE